MKKSRLALAIFATLGEEVALALFILLGLPRLGVKIPLGGLIAMMAGLAAYGVVSFRLGNRALKKKPVTGFTDMVGISGIVIESLAPKGVIKIGSELWEAESAEHPISVGEKVIVVERSGLKLIVRKGGTDSG